MELVRRGLVASRAEAREAIEAGRVLVGGAQAGKASSLVAPEDPVAVEGEGRAYVSRGGVKLAAALDAFGIDPRGRAALDAGAATGGFTDVLLQRGAAHVTAVDVGYGQLAWTIRKDPRVAVLERFNVRDLRPEDLEGRPELVVADLSFISLAKVLPALVRVAADGADLVLLVKPQFEAGRADVGSGGVVRDPAVWARVIREVAAAASEAGAGPLGLVASPVRGPAGNVEFLLHARVGDQGAELDVEGAVAGVPS
ncbi:MAG TPA: TlyA family RNA methyltransferase [Actinomycetota bacterium]